MDKNEKLRCKEELFERKALRNNTRSWGIDTLKLATELLEKRNLIRSHCNHLKETAECKSSSINSARQALYQQYQELIRTVAALQQSKPSSNELHQGGHRRAPVKPPSATIRPGTEPASPIFENQTTSWLSHGRPIAPTDDDRPHSRSHHYSGEISGRTAGQESLCRLFRPQQPKQQRSLTSHTAPSDDNTTNSDVRASSAKIASSRRLDDDRIRSSNACFDRRWLRLSAKRTRKRPLSRSYLCFPRFTVFDDSQIGRDILKNINGEFRAGELTAIMGPSGAGKSTLLDILAGYTESEFTGEISINKQQRDLKRFRRQSAYIMQAHDLQPHLTVLEAMHFSANLKIGTELSPASKKIRMNEILCAIGLQDNKKTRTSKLSGGQKKRLAIALEIVNNPPVMFFDEPTSGLDNSTSKKCVELLKQLAREGRTIICTIHQPSALLLNMFDHLFTVAEGQCIFSGTANNIVPFLKELEIICPEHYSPSDFLLEIATHDYGRQNDKLVAKTENGKTTTYRRHELFTPFLMPILESPVSIELPASPVKDPSNSPFTKPKKLAKKLSLNPEKWCGRDEVYTTSFCRQFSLLLLRTFLILSRDQSLMTMRFIIHCSIAVLIGMLYFGIGNQAAHIFNSFNYVFFSIMFLMFTAFSSMTMAFPLELPIITREHFNRWYSLRAYYIAMTVADIPIQFLCTVTYISITYYMTGQPLEAYRMGLFTLICLMVAWVAQGLGLLVASLFDVKNGAIFGPFFICPFLIFSGFFIHLNDAHVIMHWLFHISFLKYALQGATVAIFGYDRPKLECEETYCHFVLPKKFLKEIDMLSADFVEAVIALAVIFFVFRVAAFYVMRYRLKNKS
ncbi:ATP-binding cassette subfamily G member 4-like [Armigeres subalbatus]|uniref:ATP-binding cassette subfamily G member 4-like n=1 Tax=Armigeres subalbatus TaxID=124917 RepID=UPI002ED60A83